MSKAKAAPETAQPAGSPPPGEPVFLVVGKLQRPHGLRGEVIMEVITDFPERLRSGVTVYVGEAHQPQRIRSRRWHDRALLLAFDSCLDSESVGQFRNQLVCVRADDRPALPEGEYYHHQILGLSVVSDTGQALGRLVQILSTGANDVYIVRPEAGPEVLLPVTEEVILRVDLERGEILVHLLPGLLPE
jgi:16S rRNA processing protein RimM